MKGRNIALIATLMLQALALQAEDYSVASPDGRFEATVSLTDGMLSYNVKKEGTIIVKDSPLGLTLATEDLTQGLSFVSVATEEVDDPYWLPIGKQTSYRDHCNTLSLVTSKGTWRQTVQFRLYDDGFAFRYVLPKYGTHYTASLTGESSRLRFSNFKYCLGCCFASNVQSPNYPYEGTYTRYNTWSALTSEGDARFNTPALVSNGKDYMLVSEADNRGIFCTSLLKAESSTGEFSYSWTGKSKDYAVEKEQRMSISLPAYTPWRMVVCGSLATVFETTMTENLCPPSTETDLSWIKPGRSAWYWGGSDGNKEEIRKEYGGLKEGELAYADLAAEMGWEYTLIDGGWSPSWVKEVVMHANANGVEALLWQNANLSNCQDFSLSNMENTLKQWQRWGIKGIKVDFWEDDSRETMERMEKLLKLAGKYRMLVNFHGCTRPSGLRRTYPYLMTQEGIYGGEQNFWASDKITATHHINLLFTRNVVGAADYTPGDFAHWYGALLTRQSIGHHMALLTAFESGITHIAESPGNLRYFLGRDIMKRLPTVWDESHLLEGSVQQYATVARRNGQDWWVSGISVPARTCRIKLDFLDEGTDYTAYIYRDGNCRSELKFQKMAVAKGQTLSLKELNEGGFLMQISPDPYLDTPQERTTYEAEATANTLNGNGNRNTYNTLHASAGGYITNLGLGNMLRFNNVKADVEGDYILTLYYITCDTRMAKLLVNGEQVGDTITFHGNSSITNTYNPEGMSWKYVPVHLKAGTNTVTIQSYTDLWAPNFDRITVHPLPSTVTGINAPQGSTAQGTDSSPRADNATYDLSGRRVKGNAKGGIVIKGGRKYVE